MADFDYDNLTGRPSGPFVRIGSRLFQGVRKVQDQIVPFAAAWQAHNIRMLTDDRPVWIALGDSMTQGIGASGPEHGWVGQLHSQLKAAGRDYRIINLSASGARIRDVIDVQLPLMRELELMPDLVTVMIGSNDLVRKKFRVHAAYDFEAMLEQLPQGSVVANLLGGRTESQAIDRQLRQAANANLVTLADMRTLGPRSWRGKVAEDKFHPNEAGYSVIAGIFAQAIGL